MPLLIVGLGSIGRRHLKNLHHLGYRELYAVSSGRSTMPADELPLKATAATMAEGLKRFRPKAVFVCNPTSLHVSAGTAAAEAGAHIFLEKPVAHTWGGLAKLSETVARKGLHAYVGFQFRQHPVLQSVRNLIKKGKLGEIRTVHAEWGEYLPGWHPWEDYRQSYSAREDLGGGVTFTLCHPFDYLRWMLGEPQTVSAVIERTGGLDIPVDDIHRSVWEFPGGITASVHLDYFQRPGIHRLSVVGNNCKLDWDNTTGTAVLYDQGRESVRIAVDAGFERNQLFLAELREFMTGIETGEFTGCSLADGLENMRMILAGKAASAQGRKLTLRSWDPGVSTKEHQHEGN